MHTRKKIASKAVIKHTLFDMKPQKCTKRKYIAKRTESELYVPPHTNYTGDRFRKMNVSGGSERIMTTTIKLRKYLLSARKSMACSNA